MTTSRREKLLELLPKLLEAHGYIGNLWHIDDVKVARPDLTTDQCLQVLKQCESHHDGKRQTNPCATAQPDQSNRAAAHLPGVSVLAAVRVRFAIPGKTWAR